MPIKSDDGEEYAEIDVTTIGETDFAVKFDDGIERVGDEVLWVPKSVMEDWPDLYKTGTALVARWFAEKEGLV